MNSTDHDLPEPSLRFTFEARVDVDPMIHIANRPSEDVLFFPITGGTVSGDITGTIVSGGGDWATDRGGVTELEARYLIRTEDDAVIDVVNRGYHHAAPAVMDRLDAGEDVPESEYYYRTSPMFRTDSSAHQWLTRTVFIGMARSEGSQVCIRFFALA